jgi:hypothetical protein
MKTNKVLSFFLALVLVFGALIVVMPQKVAAAYADRVDEKGNPLINYLTTPFESPDSKLKNMTLYKAQNGYAIYVDEYTGEIAFQDMETGDAIFSNPYDVGVSGNANSNSVKRQLLSQIALTYKDNKDRNAKTMYSFEEAAERGQIGIKNIKNGIRMEYAIGEIVPTRLVPRRISKERFETMILAHITNDHDRDRLISFYQLYDSNDKTLTETQAKEIEAKFPITRRMPIYVLSTNSTDNERKDLERIIKAYCAEYYTLDDMEQDHSDTDYTGVEIAPACFRMALEYTIEEDGLSVRLPANGIRFDESNYTLLTVSVLPFMGAGNTNNDGYTFIPDGSGAIIRYSDIRNASATISSQTYGADYAYITIAGGQNHLEETMRYPVFGNVVSQGSQADDGSSSGNVGFVAIVTEGDSMAEIVARSDGLTHKYSYAFARFTPRPSDTYNLAAAVEGAKSADHLVVSPRKYTGSYIIKYKLLSDKTKENGNNYECSYVGMAKVYRDYLIDQGVLVKDTEVDKDIPLYIETFGSIKSTSTFLSFPVSVNRELTTFDDIAKIYDELSESGITNIKFKLSGYANGGLTSTYPAKVKWVSALGGKSGFNDLKDYAEEKGFGIYPDFDFAYVTSTGYFDGYSEKTDAVKTIDGRYTSRKYYDSTTQSLEDDFAKAISPSRYPYFAEEFIDDYSEYGLNRVSVSTLGTALNSDFDDKDPYNREDSKKFTVEMLETLKDTYGDIMTDGGNAYALPYVNHIIGAPTDSSNYLVASQAVPFTGFVLHGFVNFAGNALNTEGDVDYSLLKAVENGASIYFTVAYENINELKESQTYNKYFSVGYEVWKDEIAEKYNKINDALKDLQTSLLDSHSFITGYRVPTEADFAADKAENDAKQAENDRLAEEQAKKEELDRLLAERKGVTYVPPKNSGGSKIADTTRTADDGTAYSTDNKYYVSSGTGTIVKETYDNDTVIYINYNSFDVVITDAGQTIVIDALGFTKR